MDKTSLITEVEHIGIKARDIDQSVKFYTEVLGLKFLNSMQLGDIRLDFLQIGTTVIELVEMKDGQDYDDGVVNHIAFKVADIKEAVQHIKKHGVELISEEPGDLGGGRYNFFFRGPSGEKLEFFQG